MELKLNGIIYDEGKINGNIINFSKKTASNTQTVIYPQMELGSISRTDGTLSESSSNIRSVNYIEVEEGKTYSITNTVLLLNNLCVFYDENKNFITGWYEENGVSYNYKWVSCGKTIVAPTGAKYLKLMISVADTTTKVIIRVVK